MSKLAGEVGVALAALIDACGELSRDAACIAWRAIGSPERRPDERARLLRPQWRYRQPLQHLLAPQIGQRGGDGMLTPRLDRARSPPAGAADRGCGAPDVAV